MEFSLLSHLTLAVAALCFSLTPVPFFWCRPPSQGLPPVLPPLPKRPALEKANGANTMFNAGVFQYQQALANMQFQQQAAFIPSGGTLVFYMQISS